MGQKIVNALIDGGNATPAPPLGPSLAQFKVNVGKIVQDINGKTKEYQGMKVPVKIIIDDVTKDYKIEIGTPPVSSLIRKELGLKRIAPEKTEEPAAAEATEVKETKETEKKEVKGVEEAKSEVAAEEKPKEEEKPKVRIMVGNLTIDQCIKIAKMKRDNLLSKDMKRAVKEIVSSCVSMPITVENKNPKEVLKDINEGKYDSKISA